MQSWWVFTKSTTKPWPHAWHSGPSRERSLVWDNQLRESLGTLSINTSEQPRSSKLSSVLVRIFGQLVYMESQINAIINWEKVVVPEMEPGEQIAGLVRKLMASSCYLGIPWASTMLDMLCTTSLCYFSQLGIQTPIFASRKFVWSFPCSQSFTHDHSLCLASLSIWSESHSVIKSWYLANNVALSDSLLSVNDVVLSVMCLVELD